MVLKVVIVYAIRAMGFLSLALLMSGKSFDLGWNGVDVFMIAIWLWSEWDLWVKDFIRSRFKNQ